MTNGLFFGSITVVLGTITSLLSFVLLPFCNPVGMVMRCHYTSVADGFVGIAIALIGVAYLLLPKAQLQCPQIHQRQRCNGIA